VEFNLSQNPLYAKKTSNLPGFLANAANGVANKPGSAVRVYISAIVLLITLFITGSMLYGGVRSSVTAIGRNPLAQKLIVTSLIQIVISGLIVLVAGTLLGYLILRL